MRHVVGERNVLVRDVATVTYRNDAGPVRPQYDAALFKFDRQCRGRGPRPGSRQINDAIEAAGQPPKGVRVDIRGQITPMQEMFSSMAIGLTIAVVTIMVMLTAYFESPRLALAAVSAVPGVLSGVVLLLFLTRTTLNIESFMGSIMCIGVSLSNSVMMVAFICQRLATWKEFFRRCLVGSTGTTSTDRDDRLRDDRGHGSNGAGLGAWQRNASAIGPGCDRRTGRFDICYVANCAVRIRTC